MVSNPISVLMSLYKKEKPAYLAACLDSIMKQTELPEEILIVLDGPITADLQVVLDEYRRETDLIHLLPQATNQGLGIALALGVEACQYPIIARMDTDDIMLPERLASQYRQFANDDQLAICGTNISEFEGQPDHVIGHRSVPEHDEEIRVFSKRRNPFNHMTVMYRKEAVIAAGNYQPLKGFEDYYLWARMLKKGFKGYNVQQELVSARTGKDMYARRGGLDYLVSGIKGRYHVYRVGLGKIQDFVFVTGVHVVVSLMPNRVRRWFYEKTIHA